ncbi:MAG: His/Gly/Thr/Pro-type tRNA ligase C-terminal domain-containing protein, partial [Lachnospiraceae bacterium]|nr:His/Gly/Thr/Pro-type tRNA ligase C-terminal domain-containing protein [Lachnospiraceae bacterium]
PPKVAPTQVRVIPIRTKDENCVNESKKLMEEIKNAGIRVDNDLADKTPGYKFSEQEMLGIPLRCEIGPKDIENKQVVLVRRDNGEKIVVKRDKLIDTINATLEDIQKNMYVVAKKHLDENIREAHSKE